MRTIVLRRVVEVVQVHDTAIVAGTREV
jgi:hypothetical protein